MKQCSRCKETKDESDFRWRSDRKNTLRSSCKDCDNAAVKKWRDKNPEKSRESVRKSLNKNKEKYRESTNGYWRERRKIERTERELASSENLELDPRLYENFIKSFKEVKPEFDHIEYGRRWRENNREKDRERKRNWYRNNKDRAEVKLSFLVRDMLYRTLSGEKTGNIYETLGYSQDKLKQRLEYQFTEGMHWGNHGEWEVDHKIPVSYFLKKGENRPHIINALGNLKPLWKNENRSKWAKLIY